MRIGGLEIAGQVGLAPMAGATDSAFRRVCADLGAAWTVTEMMSAKAALRGDRKSLALGDLGRDRRPVLIQLFGADPAELGQAAALLAKEAGPDGIDINMGCPMPKITGGGAGSALLRDPRLCGELVAAVRRRVDLPVTVKLRSGWDREHITAVEVALRCQEAGAAAVCVHGRTRDQLYRGQADWEIIRRVREALEIPVIGNGDVTGAQSAAQMLAQTGCAAALVGRGALGNPWVFREINAYLRDSCTILPPPGVAQRIVTLRRHIALLCQEKGEGRGMREARKHVGWYLRGLRGAAGFRKKAGELCTLADLDALLAEVYQANSEGAGEDGVPAGREEG